MRHTSTEAILPEDTLQTLDNLVHVAVFITGATVVAIVLSSAAQTVILPRGVPLRLGRWLFISLRVALKVVIRRSSSYERRDRVLAMYAPMALLSLLTSWLLLVLGAFAAMDWGLGVHPVRHAFALSGSSMLTLGFSAPADLPTTVLAFAEASIGLLLVALLITFLPSIYAAFQERERAVTRLQVHADLPPAGANILIRFHRLDDLDHRIDLWIEWERWFVAVEQTHTMYTALAFFRSALPEHSWVTAAGAVLDAASLSLSCLDAPRDVEGQLMIRAGYLALRRVASVFRLTYDPDPAPDAPIAVTRGEFDEAYRRLAAAGLAVKPDQDQCWRDFAGWRVNYDTPLIRLATLTEAPLAPWSSDRGLVPGHKLTFMERIRQ